MIRMLFTLCVTFVGFLGLALWASRDLRTAPRPERGPEAIGALEATRGDTTAPDGADAATPAGPKGPETPPAPKGDRPRRTAVAEAKPDAIPGAKALPAVPARPATFETPSPAGGDSPPVDEPDATLELTRAAPFREGPLPSQTQGEATASPAPDPTAGAGVTTGEAEVEDATAEGPPYPLAQDQNALAQDQNALAQDRDALAQDQDQWASLIRRMLSIYAQVEPE